MTKTAIVGVEKRMRPSKNWFKLQRTIAGSKRKATNVEKSKVSRKRVKLEHHTTSPESSAIGDSEPDRNQSLNDSDTPQTTSLGLLRNMINGELTYTKKQQRPGKYLALDCEMVGVGANGSKASLARVSLVNYFGAIQLDEFVRPSEKVVDYRTKFSGVRKEDLINAKPFEKIQKQVASLLENRVLIGHAISNDLNVLLLTHPRPLTRDTQSLAAKHKIIKGRLPALRILVRQQFGIEIQSGEHCSVMDARATMAIYRLHMKEWEKGYPPMFDQNRNARTRRQTQVAWN